jgi:predicted RecA/RadA family phage recombinase
VYWDAANSRITTVATGNKYVGVTVAAAAATTTSARVRLSQ